jgi:hypothetical protein
MAKIQGEFSNKDAAQQAVALLIKAGVDENHIRLWNIIPDQGRRSSDSGTVGGAVIGGVVAGPVGLATGAALGSTLDEEAPMAEPSGVRLVVDIVPGGPDVVDLLQEAGAKNAQEISY